MSLYALTASVVQQINRKWFGKKLEIDGKSVDTGVEELKRELIAGFSSTVPIDLQGSFQLNQPTGKPAIQIFVGSDSPIIQFVDYNHNRIVNLYGDGTIKSVNNAFNSTNSNAVTTNDTNANYTNAGPPINSNATSQPAQTQTLVTPVTLPGFTGTIAAWVSASVGVSGCIVTITPTTKTLTFQNGVCVSIV